MNETLFSRRLWAFFVLLFICLYSLSAQAKYGGGIGTPEDPYQIRDANHMQAIGTNTNDWNKHFKLMADIDLSGYTGTSFNIIGDEDNPFRGVFDGNGHKISNFSYTSTGKNYVGLFGYVGKWGENFEIKNLGLIDPNINADTGRCVGSLVGYVRNGTIVNCYAETTSVSGNSSVGGLAGYVHWEGGVTQCYVDGGSVSGGVGTGGLVGESECFISDCYGTCSVSGEIAVGGLVGLNSGEITNSYAAGPVTGIAGFGGLCGLSFGGTIAICFWDVETSGIGSAGDHNYGATGKTTEQMQTASTFVCWGYKPVWTIDEGTDYPRLVWENRPGEILVFPIDLFGGGMGDPNDPFLIYTAEQLNSIGLLECDLDKHFKLMADIDLSEYDGREGRPKFNIIGGNNTFSGVFDGNGHAISNFTYDSNDIDRVGLFSYVSGYKAEIKHLGLIDPQVNAGTGNNVGSLAGISAKVTKCYVDGGSVTGEDNIGGLVGLNYGEIADSCSTTVVIGSESVGGLVGKGTRAITNCFSTVSVTGTKYVGGLVGYNQSDITSCFSTGGIDGDDVAGGLVGYNKRGSVTQCCSTGSVEGRWNLGGLCGENEEIISSSYSNTAVIGGDCSRILGGLCGKNVGIISNCYAIGSVYGEGASGHVGGLCGENADIDPSGGTIINCYSTGSVTGGDTSWGLHGLCANNWGVIHNSFWDTQTSGIPSGYNGVGKTTAQMTNIATYAGWGDSIWIIDDGNDYPRLAWEQEEGIPIIDSVRTYSGGEGTINEPYLVAEVNDLITLGFYPADWNKHFRLSNDIDLSSYVFETHPIPVFFGLFDGGDNKILNMTIDVNDTPTAYLGLFGMVSGEHARVVNLRLKDVLINGNGSDHQGGLCGSNEGTITNCHTSGSISYNHGSRYLGGLCGSNHGDIFQSSSVSEVSGNQIIGGLCGGNLGTLCNCSVKSSKIGGKWQVGGLCGENDGIITACFAEAAVYGYHPAYYHGGLCGWNNRTIRNCYSKGSASTDGSYLGGLCGMNHGPGTITNCYTTVSLEWGFWNSGWIDAFCGRNYGGTITNCFWNVETSDAGGYNSGATGKTTKQMQTASTYIDAGWDFENVWWIFEGISYPRHLWEIPTLHTEPEITLGTTNTISWEPIPGNIEYYAECSTDANFTNIAYNSGWITETNYDFTNLTLGKRYWYSVKSRNSAGIESPWSNVESSLQCSLSGAVETLLTPESLKNENMKNSLLNKIDEALEMVDEGLYRDALNKLQNDILQKTNGCAETGEPDKNDWIITCEEQSEIYPLIIETIAHIRNLMDQSLD